jgi:hypothetical protein
MKTNIRRLMLCRGGAVVLPPEGLRFLEKKNRKKKPCTLTSSNKNQDLDQREKPPLIIIIIIRHSHQTIKPSPSIHHPPQPIRRPQTPQPRPRPLHHPIQMLSRIPREILPLHSRIVRLPVPIRQVVVMDPGKWSLLWWWR